MNIQMLCCGWMIRSRSRNRSRHIMSFWCLMMMLMLIVLSSSATVAAGNNDNDVVTFSLHDNGSSDEGLLVTMKRTEFPTSEDDNHKNSKSKVSELFAIEMSSKIDVSKYMAPKPVIATRAFREDGELISTFDQLKPLSTSDDRRPPLLLRRVYLVAEDLEFVWPYIKYGHKQIVSTNVVPPVGGEPVVLESVSDSPRVFRVWNMATTEESTQIIEHALNATGDDAIKRSTVGSGKDKDGNDSKYYPLLLFVCVCVCFAVDWFCFLSDC